MITFLPYPDFNLTAMTLDNKRLGKQRIETKQILEINLIRSFPENYVFCRKCFLFWEKSECNPGINGIVFCPNCKLPEYMTYSTNFPIKFENHPAVLMWRGYEIALAYYGKAICEHWIERGFKDNQLGFFLNSLKSLNGEYEDPIWMNDSRVHSSHRAALLYKNLEHYSKFGWTEIPNISYFWAVRKEDK